MKDSSNLGQTKSAAVTHFDVSDKFQIVYARTIEIAKEYRDSGFIPIECSFGDESVVDDKYQMDHHGELSHLESVAIRAYRDHFGEKADDPRFVVTGYPDEDATFAICSLTGCLPHPTLAEKFPNAPTGTKEPASKNLLYVANLIAKADVDPDTALSLLDSWYGRLILNWRLDAHPTARDIVAWSGGVSRWRNIFTFEDDGFIEVSKDVQEQRLSRVLDARSQKYADGRIAVVDFSEFGPNSAYYRYWFKDENIEVLVAFIGGPDGLGSCSFVCRDLTTAKKLFGPNGLLSAYRKLFPAGCGGRETIGGSRRGGTYSWQSALSFGKQFEKLIVDRPVTK